MRHGLADQARDLGRIDRHLDEIPHNIGGCILQQQGKPPAQGV